MTVNFPTYPDSLYPQSMYCAICRSYYTGTFHTCIPTHYPNNTTIIYQPDQTFKTELKELIDVLKRIADKLDIIDNKE